LATSPASAVTTLRAWAELTGLERQVSTTTIGWLTDAGATADPGTAANCGTVSTWLVEVLLNRAAAAVG
jgi:hypothetical protein